MLEAGADELYFGLLLPEWAEELDEADVWSRRQGRAAHVGDYAEAQAIAECVRRRGRLAALACNARYSRWQVERVLAAIGRWESLGGQAVVVSDLGLLAALDQSGTRLRRHLSLLTGVFNSASVLACASLGACRVILPRELTPSEIAGLIRAAPHLEYEVVALYQRCPFIDGMCGFHHRPRLPEGIPADFTYRPQPGRPRPVTWSRDPQYEGHGCQLAWQTSQGPVPLGRGDDYHRPVCAACRVLHLQQAGVSILKIAGRGYPTEVLVQGVRFLREVIGRATGPAPATPDAFRALYARTFGTRCEPACCYYPGPDAPGA